MGKEIERKFRVDKLPHYLVLQGEHKIIQTYLKTGDEEIRLRHSTDLIDGSPVHYLTKKVGSGLVREENEMEIPSEAYNALLKSTTSEPIIKTRTITNVMGHKIEIDIYENEELKGLIIAEIEFNTVDDANNAKLPSWLSEDVTEDKSYKNQSLWEKLQVLKQEREEKEKLEREERDEKLKADELLRVEQQEYERDVTPEPDFNFSSDISYTLEGCDCCRTHLKLLLSSTDKEWITSKAHEKVELFDRVVVKEWVDGRVVKSTHITNED